MNRRLKWIRRLPGLLARYYRDAIRSLRQRFGFNGMTNEIDDFNWDYFVKSGCEYYATARFAMHAQRSYVCGNLFHHAVEMLLKGELLQRGVSLDELKRTGHSLRRLWRMYKAYYPKADLERHNRIINRLDKYEEIRYPNPALGSIGVAMEWSDEPVPITTYNIKISVDHAQGECHANPPRGDDYLDCHARQPARLWASGIRQGTAVRAGCGRWRPYLNPTDAAGHRPAKRCAQ